MPTFTVYTNIPKKDIPLDFLKDASALIAKVLGKPESYVTVRVHPDQMMSHGGTTDPCGSVELYSIGKLGEEENQGHTEAIGDFISEKLKIPKNRFYITFVDLQRADVGYDGKTFAKK